MQRRLSLALLVLMLAACNPARSAAPTGVPASVTPPPTSVPTLPVPQGPDPSYKVAAFYYPWYGTPQFDQGWVHWTQNGHTPPQDIGSDYYPALGPYSSNDPAVVAQHMAWLRQAGIGIIIVSWWGRNSDEERPLHLILQTAERFGIKVAFHIEPYTARTADSLVQDVKYIYDQYGSSPAFFRSTATTTYSTSATPKGMFFIWCVKYIGGCAKQAVNPEYWQGAADAIHALPQGGLLIANMTNATWVTGGHFDGLYNYATLHLNQHGGFAWARKVPPGALYIPSVIPGNSARRVGYPEDTYVPRNDGQTYSDQWSAALNTGVTPDLVTITSFNEWHEGTMIEPPALGKDDGHGFSYADFGGLAPEAYLNLTRQWIDKLQAKVELPLNGTGTPSKTASQWRNVRLVSSVQ